MPTKLFFIQSNWCKNFYIEKYDLLEAFFKYSLKINTYIFVKNLMTKQLKKYFFFKFFIHLYCFVTDTSSEL